MAPFQPDRSHSFDTMTAERTFQHIQFCPQKFDFGADVTAWCITSDDGKIADLFVIFFISNDEDLNAIANSLDWDWHLDGPLIVNFGYLYVRYLRTQVGYSDLRLISPSVFTATCGSSVPACSKIPCQTPWQNRVGVSVKALIVVYLLKRSAGAA